MDHSLASHSLNDILVVFQFGAMANGSAVNNPVHVFVCTCFYISGINAKYFPSPCHMVVAGFLFKETNKLFSRWLQHLHSQERYTSNLVSLHPGQQEVWDYFLVV